MNDHAAGLMVFLNHFMKARAYRVEARHAALAFFEEVRSRVEVED